MKKLLTLAIVLLAGILYAEAGQVNEQEARQKAMTFMTKSAKARGTTSLSRVFAPLKTASAMESVNDAPLYIFNLDGGGYVIVSGDDRTSESLGFSENGHINPDRMPLNMKNWLDGYVRKIQQLPAHVLLHLACHLLMLLFLLHCGRRHIHGIVVVSQYAVHTVAGRNPFQHCQMAAYL